MSTPRHYDREEKSKTLRLRVNLLNLRETI